MPRGGHNAKPVQLHSIQGTVRADRKKPNTPAPPVADDLAPPPGLDYYGKWLWNKYAPILQRNDLFTEADALSLSTLCMAYSRWRKALKDLESVTPKDETYRDIAITVEKAEHSMRLLGTEFGMTPASRSRISVSQKDDKADPFEDWAKRA